MLPWPGTAVAYEGELRYLYSDGGPLIFPLGETLGSRLGLVGTILQLLFFAIGMSSGD
jgi:hypothetical protein